MNRALYIACENNSEKIVKLLLDKGADPNKCEKPCLDVACQNRNAEIVKLLLENEEKKFQEYLDNDMLDNKDGFDINEPLKDSKLTISDDNIMIVIDNQKYIRLWFSEDPKCCEISGFGIGIRNDDEQVDFESYLYQEQSQLSKVLDILNTEEFQGFKLSDTYNPKFSIDAKNDQLSGWYVVELQYTNSVITLFCFNYHNGYYPHTGTLEKTIDENGNLCEKTLDRFNL